MMERKTLKKKINKTRFSIKYSLKSIFLQFINFLNFIKINIIKKILLNSYYFIK
jgi:hypothetical protein